MKSVNKKLVGWSLIVLAVILILVALSLPKKEQTIIIPIPDAHSDIIKVSSPLPNSTIKSPLTVTGVARGNWYFEASFPVRLYDANGKELVATPAQAKGDWMTTEFVPFEVTLNFTKPTTATGTLVLQKDNPSGLP